MSLQSWSETLINSLVDGTALTGTATDTSILDVGSKYTLPANFFVPGKCLRLTAMGQMSNIITTPGTLTFGVKFGSSEWQSQALALNIVAKTNVTWWLEMLFTCRNIGTAGNNSGVLFPAGKFTSESVIGSPLPTVGGSGVLLIPASAPAVSTNTEFNTNTAQQVDLFAKWSLSNANSIICNQFILESLN
jgi:hypothetical protein